MSLPGYSRASSLRSAGKPERLLRASVTAFCSITRPTRRETAQLDDLATPLLGAVSDECLRYVAAALSESPYAPPVLVRKLADQSVDISAPLLVRSPILSAIDLVALIGRHGLPHARAIAMRPGLDQRILRLIRSIGALDEAAKALPEPVVDAAEETRQRLRAMMLPAAGANAPQPTEQAEPQQPAEADHYARLRTTALSGEPALFYTALADALDIGFADACAIAGAGEAHGLMVALKSLALTEEQAFLILQCVWPGRHRDQARAIGTFIEAYGSISTTETEALLETWRGEADAVHGEPANEPSRPTILRAS